MHAPLRFLGAVILCFGGLIAQTNTGSIGGTVLDSSAAVIAGARATLTNIDTSSKHTVESNDLGTFLFPALPPGSYELLVEKDGFKKSIRTGIQLNVQEAQKYDFTLAVGSMTEAVEVQANAVVLETATSSLGQVVSTREILELPLNGRNTLALVGLTAGVQAGGGFGGLPATGNTYASGDFSVSGGRGQGSEVIIDGATVNAGVVIGPLFVPSVDAVEEFKVQTNSFSSEFGRTNGGVVNVVMRSGTNQYHGGLYDFFRNRVLDSNNFFNNASGKQKSVYIFNEFGGTFGGPVVLPKIYNGKDKLFFFFGYEGLRFRTGVNSILTLPTELQRKGDFSATQNSAGQRVQIYDPLTTTATASGAYTRTAFPNNVIPSNRIDSVAAKVITYYPQPNLAGNLLTGANNFFGSGGATNLANQYNARIDRVFDRHRVFGRYSYNNAERGAANLFDNDFGGVNPTGGQVPITIRGQQFVFRDTYTATPTLVVDVGYGVVRGWVFKQPYSMNKNLTNLGFPETLNGQLPERSYPNFSFTNYYQLYGNSGDLIRRGDYTHSFTGTATKIAGRHVLKIGSEYRLMRVNDYQPDTPLSFSFGTAWTQQNPFQVSATAGNSIGSFLLGAASSGTDAISPAIALQNHYAAFFVQDDIRVSSHLTINAGLRYELETPRTERYNRLAWFDFTAASPLAAQTGITGLSGGLAFTGINNNGRQQMMLDTNNISPRIGFAWSGIPKTVVRGGYGIFYSPLTGYGFGATMGYGAFSSSTSMVTSTDGSLTPANLLANPFPTGLNLPTGTSQGLATRAGQGLTTVDHQYLVGYTQQWNFDIQRELPSGFIGDLTYSGSHGLKQGDWWNANQLSPSYYGLGSALNQQVANPFSGVIQLGTLANATVSRAQLLLPYPQFQSVSVLLSASNAVYHSLQAKLERRMANGLSVLMAYTFSKNIGDENTSPLGLDTVTSVQDNHNRRGERALLPFDRSQRFVGNFGYALPFGRGKSLGRNWGKGLDLLAGGWQINGVATLQTGLPLALGLSSANTYGGTRPNSTGASAALSSDQRTVARWFNTSAFTQPPAYSLGNVSRTLPDVRGPGLANIDLSVFKIVTIREGLRLQFRAEAFNVLNHTRLGNPTTSFGSPTFGQITSAGDPRIGQLALKLTF